MLIVSEIKQRRYNFTFIFVPNAGADILFLMNVKQLWLIPVNYMIAELVLA